MSKYYISMWISFCLLVTYFLPRLLSKYLTNENPWTSYIYIYTLGGLFFLIGLNIVVQTKSLNLNQKLDRTWLSNMILGFIFFASLHGVWIYLSQNSIIIQPQ
jgi:4-hydroxybenzoate polyprenyltransferase